jgi:hypothetical protein
MLRGKSEPVGRSIPLLLKHRWESPMRIPDRHVLLVALLVTVAACSKEPASTPAASAPAATPAAPVAAPAPAAPAPAVAPAAPAQAVFSRAELDQMVAPLALYPDSLLAQVLMAATYPGDVADAVAWSKAHPKAEGDAAVRQVANEPWDPSVQALVAFPQALATLGQDPGWVQRLGDAFLAQPSEVMDAVQRLRHQAQAAGNLESNQYQKVSMEAAPAPAPASEPAMGTVIEQAPPQTIIIEPTDPEVVYVPAYNPTEVYGTWAYPSYPPPYYAPTPYWYPGSALMAGLAFGTGIAIADSLWGDCDWGGGDIDIDVDRYNNINTNRQIDRTSNRWSHNAANRDGVPYRDRASRENFGRQLADSPRRDAFRGDDPGRARAREQARSSMQQRGIEPARSNREARSQAQTASREMRERPQGQARDQQRERAAQTTRDRQQQAGARDSQRAQAAQASRQGGDRARAQQQSRSTSQARQQRGQNNTQARNTARQQQARSQGGARNNAFEGSRNPSQSRAQANRGRSSNASAQRSSGSRGGGGGHQVQRQAPQRQGGGGRHR